MPNMERFSSKPITCRRAGSSRIDDMSGVKLYTWAAILTVKHDENLFSRSHVDRISDKKAMTKANIIAWEY